MKISIRNFNVSIGRENILKRKFCNKSLHQNNNDNVVRIVNITTPKIVVIKNTKFPHRNSHKHTWNSPDGKTQPD